MENIIKKQSNSCCRGECEKMHSKKAQGSVEYLSIVGIALLLLIPATILFTNYARNTNDEVVSNQLTLIGNSILSKAEEMFVLGAGSWTTEEIVIPNSVVGSIIVANKDLVFVYDSYNGRTDAVFFSYRFDINNGTDCTTFCNMSFTPGINKVRIEYRNNAVQIRKVS